MFATYDRKGYFLAIWYNGFLDLHMIAIRCTDCSNSPLTTTLSKPVCSEQLSSHSRVYVYIQYSIIRSHESRAQTRLSCMR